MARGVIFDVDGTLVDSVDLHAQAGQDAFATVCPALTRGISGTKISELSRQWAARRRRRT